MKKGKDVKDMQTGSTENCVSRKGWCHNCCAMVFVFFTVFVASMIIRDGFINMKRNREFVSVKGLAERVVKADSAIWVIPLTANGEELEAVRAKIDSDISRIVDYLKKYDLQDQEIEQDTMRIYDKMAQRYYDPNNKANRFSIDNQIVIKSSNIEAIHKASKNVNELLKEGVTFPYDGYSGAYSSPRYLFTKLNEIKPDMLSEAMQEAKKAAEQLLKSSDNKVGNIKNASQGIFNVYSREATGSGRGIDQRAVAYGGAQYSTNEAYFVEKVLRVVASVDYYIE